MTDLNIAFNKLKPNINYKSTNEHIKYDYSVCPKCNSTKTYSFTNDGGSIGMCTTCYTTFKSKIITS